MVKSEKGIIIVDGRLDEVMSDWTVLTASIRKMMVIKHGVPKETANKMLVDCLFMAVETSDNREEENE